MHSDSRISFCFLVISVVISFPFCSITFLSLCNSRIIFSTEYFFSRPDYLMYSRILDLMAIKMRFTNISPLSASVPCTLSGFPPSEPLGWHEQLFSSIPFPVFRKHIFRGMIAGERYYCDAALFRPLGNGIAPDPHMECSIIPE